MIYINSQKCFSGSDKTVLDRNMNSCICQLVATYHVYEYKCTIQCHVQYNECTI